MNIHSGHRLAFIPMGMAAGLAATVVLSLAILLQQALGLLPQLSTVAVMAHLLGFRSLAGGWIAHFAIGVLLWAPLYAWIDPKIHFPHWFVGLVFASVIWLGVMAFVMPAVGAGFFGLELGPATPIVALVLHWTYGVALGTAYGLLREPATGRLHALNA